MTTRERLAAIRESIETESVSWGELAELQGLADDIDPGDVLLLEWAGVPEILGEHWGNNNMSDYPTFEEHYQLVRRAALAVIRDWDRAVLSDIAASVDELRELLDGAIIEVRGNQ